MTYKEKMEREHPTVDSDFVLFACPGHFFDGAPHCNSIVTCPAITDVKCYECWTREIPNQNHSTNKIPHLESSEKMQEVRNGSPML